VTSAHLRGRLAVTLMLALSSAATLAIGAGAQATSWHLDTAFGKHGITSVPGGGGFWSALAPGPQGSLFVGGGIGHAHGSGQDEYLLERLSRHGKLVKSFGHDGVVKTLAVDPAGETQLFALAGGKLLVSGLDTKVSKSRLALTRFTAAGKLDATFGHDGVAQYNLPNTQDGVSHVNVAIEPNGDILAAYDQDVESGPVVLVRMLPSGALDESFGSGGFLTLDADGPTPSAAVLDTLGIAPDGSILLARFAGEETVQELSSAGTPVATFASDGAAVVAKALDPSALGINALFGLPGGGVEAILGGDEAHATVARFTTTGAPEPGFGASGSVAIEQTVQAVTLGSGEETFYLATNSDGDVVLGGVLNVGLPDPGLGAGEGLALSWPVGPTPNEIVVLPGPGVVSILDGGYVAQIRS
jgi:uncharacterized delta-60 repeat protein